MARRYDSFTVRCWCLDEAGWRIEVEHLQSAARIRVPAFMAALEWISMQCAAPAPGAWQRGPAVGLPAEEVSASEERVTDGPQAN
jgi:hypothetical protein